MAGVVHRTVGAGRGGAQHMRPSCILSTQRLTATACLPAKQDWPVMNVESLSFHLKPWGFFAQSPTVDLPPARARRNVDHDEAAAATAGKAACCAALASPLISKL